MITQTDTTEHPAQMLLPQWMYRQIISDDSVKAVWCFCGAPAISYCNGLQFVCHGGGHFGVPMVMLKPRAEEQEFVERQCAKGRELLRQQIEQEAQKSQRRKRVRIRPHKISQQYGARFECRPSTSTSVKTNSIRLCDRWSKRQRIYLVLSRRFANVTMS